MYTNKILNIKTNSFRGKDPYGLYGAKCTQDILSTV